MQTQPVPPCQIFPPSWAAIMFLRSSKRRGMARNTSPGVRSKTAVWRMIGSSGGTSFTWANSMAVRKLPGRKTVAILGGRIRPLRGRSPSFPEELAPATGQDEALPSVASSLHRCRCAGPAMGRVLAGL